MIATKQLCTFKLGSHLFGVDAQSVQEVIRYQEMTKVPMAPPAISGLINLRGQIVTAVDLRFRLGLGKLADDRKPMKCRCAKRRWCGKPLGRPDRGCYRGRRQ